MNLWNLNSDFPKRLAKIKELILSENYDIVAIQEIREFEGRNQLDLLAEALKSSNLNVFKEFVEVQKTDKGSYEGIGVLFLFI